LTRHSSSPLPESVLPVVPVRVELEEVEELRAKAEDPDQFLWRYGKPYRPKRSLLKRISDYITGNTNK